MATAKEIIDSYHKEVSNKIASDLDQGKGFFWNNPANLSSLNPVNASTNNAYQGANRIRLAQAAVEMGLKDPRWVTATQAKEAGWKIKPNAVGVVCEMKYNYKGKDPSFRYFKVYNARDVEGIPEKKQSNNKYDESLDKAKLIVSSSDCKIVEKEHAFNAYMYKNDVIEMEPLNKHDSEEAYLAKALYAVMRSTSNEGRLNRKALDISTERLISDIATAFLKSDLSIMFEETHFGHYSNTPKGKGYQELLEKNPDILFEAANLASAACKYVHQNTLKEINDKVITKKNAKENDISAEINSMQSSALNGLKQIKENQRDIEKQNFQSSNRGRKTFR